MRKPHMEIDLIASTVFDKEKFAHLSGFESDPYAADADALAEAAGRQCYNAWGRKNPKTATNWGYLANIIDHQHFSVLEHSSATFLVRGVSRALLAELTRHRHLSFSVESQRYVRQTDRVPVTPPALVGTPSEQALLDFHQSAERLYEELRETLLSTGMPRKQALEAARSVLINAHPVDLVVTGNLRAWREVTAKRWHVAADAEMQEFAGLILNQLKNMAPAAMQDIDGDNPIGNEEIRRAA